MCLRHAQAAGHVPPTAQPLGFPHLAHLEASSAGAVLTLPLLPPHLPLAPQLPLPGCPSPTGGTLLPLAGGGTAERPPWIRFSSVRQGHQRQPPTGHGPHPHSITGNVISVVDTYGAPRTQQACQALLEQSLGTPGSRRGGHAREAPTDSGWTAGWVWPCRQPPQLWIINCFV